jgi:hypothetical protein
MGRKTRHDTGVVTVEVENGISDKAFGKLLKIQKKDASEA